MASAWQSELQAVKNDGDGATDISTVVNSCLRLETATSTVVSFVDAVCRFDVDKTLSQQPIYLPSGRVVLFESELSIFLTVASWLPVVTDTTVDPGAPHKPFIYRLVHPQQQSTNGSNEHGSQSLSPLPEFVVPIGQLFASTGGTSPAWRYTGYEVVVGKTLEKDEGDLAVWLLADHRAHRSLAQFLSWKKNNSSRFSGDDSDSDGGASDDSEGFNPSSNTQDQGDSNDSDFDPDFAVEDIVPVKDFLDGVLGTDQQRQTQQPAFYDAACLLLSHRQLQQTRDSGSAAAVTATIQGAQEIILQTRSCFTPQLKRVADDHGSKTLRAN